MTTKNKWAGSISGSLRVLTVGLLLCAASTFISARPVSAADAITDDNVAERVASAQTAADHEALAAYFDSQAAAAAAKIKLHEKMLTSANQKISGKSAASWEMHCKSMIRSYKEAQKEAEALAEAQRGMAKEAGK
jgi:hypothetical protein